MFPNSNPVLFVDLLIEHIADSIVLIQRAVPPYGWALPGGAIDIGESPYHAAIREALEETSLKVTILEQFHNYCFQTNDGYSRAFTTVFLGEASGTPLGASDASSADVFPLVALPQLIPDHRKIVQDYIYYKEWGVRPEPDGIIISGGDFSSIAVNKISQGK